MDLMRWMFVAVLVAGCGETNQNGKQSVEPESMGATADAGSDAGGCPDYKPDAGVVVVMRGCPLTIEYGIH